MAEARHVRILRSFARAACARPKTMLAVALALTAASWWPVWSSGMDQAFNVARLLPQDVPAARDFTRVVTDFGGTDEGVVVLRLGGADERGDGDAARAARRALAASPEGVPGPAGRLADDIVARLRASADPVFRDAHCRRFTDADRDYLRYEALAHGGLLLLEPGEAERAAAAFAPDRIRANVGALARFRGHFGDNDLTRLKAQFDTLGLRDLFRPLIARFGGADASAADESFAGHGRPPANDSAESVGRFSPSTDAEEDEDVPPAPADIGFLDATDPGYLLDKDARLLLILYYPGEPAQKVAYAQSVVRTARRAAEEAYAALPADARGRIRIEYTGGYEIAVRHEENIFRALRDTFISTLLFVLLLFGVAFRRLGVFVYVGLPLLIVVSWTVGIGFLVFGRLNMVSCAFAAVLVSLGVDYAVHVYNRYVEERRRGRGVPAAFEESLAHTGWGVVMGMATTALAFLALLATRFTQLREFGVLVGFGLALTVPVTFLVLPALIALRHGRRAEGARAARPVLFGLPAVERLVARRPRACAWTGLAAGAVALAALAFGADRMRFDERIDPLRPPMREIDLGAEVSAAFARRTGGSVMAVAYSDADGRAGEEAALDRAAAQADACRRMQGETVDGLPALVDYDSILRYLPSPAVQRQTLERLRRVDWAAAADALREAAAEFLPGRDFGFAPDGRPVDALALPWDDLAARFAAQREAAERSRPGGDHAARVASAQRDWLAYTFSLKFLERHRRLAARGEPRLPSDFAATPLARHLGRRVATRKREVDLREPLPAALAFPAALAEDALSRDGRVVAAAGTRFADADALRALYHDPSLPYPGQVKRAVLAVPGWAVKTMLYPPVDPTTRAGDPKLGDAWVAHARERLDAPLAATPGDAPPPLGVLTGIPLLAHELAVLVKADFRRLSWGVLAGAVAALAWFFRRHPFRIAASLLPIMLGMLYLFGFMVVAGVRVNFVNVLVVPILIGLGVDAGIHVVQRYFESGRRLEPTVVGTGRAILITGLTSMIGFGSLRFGAYGGAAGMGGLMIVGLAASMLVSLVVLPGLLAAYAPPPPPPGHAGGGEDPAPDAP